MLMTHLIFQDGLLVLGTASCLFLFVTLKREVQMNARRQARTLEAMELEFQRKLASRPTWEQTPPPDSGSPRGAPRPGFNLNTRVHALRMLRSGKDVNTISGALGVPRREVELLIRMQEIATSQVANATWEAEGRLL
jgi:hypothetical protein